MPLQIAVATRCFGQPLKQSLCAAADIGASAVQIDARTEIRAAELSETGRRQFLHYLGEVGLKISSLTFPTRRTFFDSEQLDARLSATKAAMQLAHQLGARVVTVRVGRIPDNAGSAQYQTLLAVLNDLAKHGNHVGATIAITPMNDSPQSLLQLLGAVTEGPIGIDFDPAGFVIAGHAPIQAFRALHEWALNVRVRDAVRDIDGSGLEVPVGRGEVQWDEFLATLDEAAYRAWWTIDRTAGEDKQNDMARAIRYLRQIAME